MLIVVAVAAIGFMMLCVIGVLIALLLPAVQGARYAARTMSVSNNLKQIGIALHNYHSAHNQLPPAVVTNRAGDPTHSWRVTLLPFMEEQTRLDAWAVEEPWDSDSNSGLLDPLPLAYRSLLDENPSGTVTHVMSVRHPQAMIQANTAGSFQDVVDGLSNTIFAVYVQNRAVDWAAPQDISLPELQAEVAGASFSNPVLLLMGDGSVIQITKPLSAEQVQALVTRDGQEVIDFDF